MCRGGFTEKIYNLISATGPYESAPVICIAVSGGGDSMALALLADQWVKTVGGRLIGLTVDHQLRKNSASEARQVGAWLSERNIEHHTLHWQNPSADNALQENARTARYDLMEGWCREHGVLHLLLAHTAEDQAETFLMRRDRGSGPDGLAAMSAVLERQYCRLVRPLLSVEKTDLRSFLRDQKQDWIEDPSNDDPKFERIRWRNMMTDQVLSPDGFCQAAERYGQARSVLEQQAARLSARCVSIYPCGFIEIDLAVFVSAQKELSGRVLSRSLMVVGGAMYAPERRKLDRLHDQVCMHEDGVATLAGCRVECQNGTIQIARESRFLPPPLPVTAGMKLTWDRRFHLSVAGNMASVSPPVTLQPLGARGDAEIKNLLPDLDRHGIPRVVRLSLPALADDDVILNVPHLHYCRERAINNRLNGYPQIDDITFRALNSLSGSGYFVANLKKQAIS